MTIGDFSFWNSTTLVSVTIPDSVSTIGKFAFYGCPALVSVTIPESVTVIGDYAFERCASLTTIDVDPTNTNYLSIDGVLFNKTANTLIQYPCGKEGAYTVPASVIMISEYAFAYCTSTTSVTIPNSVAIIGQFSFYGCSSITSITIPGGVGIIGMGAFSNCNSLTSISFLGLVAPTNVGVDIIRSDLPEIRGHAYASSNFPTPGNIFYGLIMGSYLPYQDYSFSVNNGNATITGYNGTDVSITIPSSLGGYPVTAIGNSAFSGCSSLTSVVVPDDVTTIGPFAFEFCSSLTSITLGNGVASIGDNWLYHCTSVSSINTTSGNQKFACLDGVLYNKTITKLIQCPNGKTGVIDVPISVTTIGENALSFCPYLVYVNIPGNVNLIGHNAFIACTDLISINVSADNPNYASANGLLYDKTLTTLIQCPGGKMGAIALPESVTVIGSEAFGYCTSLTFINIPKNVTALGNYAFEFCPNLTSLTLGSGVTNIGENWLYYCTGLKSINVTASNPKYSSVDGVLYNKIVTTLLQYPYARTGTFNIISSVTAIGDYAFSNCTSLASMTIPGGVANIGVGAFVGCVALTSITFLGWIAPESIGAGWVQDTDPGILGHAYSTSNFPVPGSSFYGLTMGANLPSFDYIYTVNNGNATITGYTGAGGAIIIPTSIEGYATVAIGDNAFYQQRSISSVVIPEGVTSIGFEAFYHCPSLTSVTIPNSVSSIGGWAFSYCDSLASFEVGGSNLNYASVDGVLYDRSISTLIQCPCARAGAFTIPDSIAAVGAAAFLNCTSMTSVTIPDSVLTIGDGAFQFCNLTSVVIPNSVMAIGVEAFAFCPILTNAILGSEVSSIGLHSFYGCPSLNSVTFYGHLAPTVVGENWISGSDPGIKGHANAVSNFPAPGNIFFGLTMGALIPASPRSPSNLSAIPGDTRIFLSWVPPANDGGSNITGYILYRSTVPGGGYSPINMTTELTYVDDGLTNGQAYWYTVSSFNMNGEGPNSSEISSIPRSMPLAPGNLSITNPENRMVHLAWTAADILGGEAITAYYIYRSTVDGNEVYLNKTVSGAALFYEDLTVANGQKYFYTVCATNPGGFGPNSTEVNITPFWTPSAPVLTATAGNGQAVLSWTAPTDDGGATVSNYTLYSGTYPVLTLLANVSGTTTTYTKTGLTNGQTHHFAVAGVNAKGEGVKANVNATPSAAPQVPPGAPSSLVATGASGQIVLTWGPPSSTGTQPITEYMIYRGDSAAALAYWSHTGSTARTFTDAGLMNGMTYYYAVVAVSSVGDSAQSPAAHATTSATPPPGLPTNLIVTKGSGQVILSWIAPSSNGGAAIDYYIIYQDNIDVRHVNGNSTIIYNLINGRSYQFAVAAHNSVGTGIKTSAMIVTPAAGNSSDGGLLTIFALVAILGLVLVLIYEIVRYRRNKAEARSRKDSPALDKLIGHSSQDTLPSENERTIQSSDFTIKDEAPEIQPKFVPQNPAQQAVSVQQAYSVGSPEVISQPLSQEQKEGQSLKTIPFEPSRQNCFNWESKPNIQDRSILVPNTRYQEGQASNQGINEVEKGSCFIDYKLGKMIGAGGFSEIYLAECNGTEFAMKVPKAINWRNSETVRLDQKSLGIYEKESQIWSDLTRNIPGSVIKLIAAGVEPFPWFAMERAEKDLKTAMNDFGEKDKDLIALDILLKISVIHGQGVVHKDIKPENILFVNGQWKFTDFGLSKIVDASAKSSQMISGTIHYMAPEQISADNYGTTDVRTDLWQMGVLMTELYGGNAPFEAPSPHEFMAKVMFAQPDLSNIPEHLRSVIDKALQKKKESRWQNAMEFRDALVMALKQ